MKKVLFNVSFNDRYTGKLNKAGTTAEMTEERIAEIKEVNPNFISVIGNAEPAPAQGETTQGEPAPAQGETKKPKATKKAEDK